MSTRRRQAQRRNTGKRVLLGLGIAALAVLWLTPEMRHAITGALYGGVQAVQVSAASSVEEITLEERTVHALQLGAFGNGEHAQRELNRLRGEGILCVLWQREQMRLVCDAGKSRAALDTVAAGAQAVWMTEDVWPQVRLRITTDARGAQDVLALLGMPDALFDALCQADAHIADATARARPAAQAALAAYPEHALYTQLAQSLLNWCSLMDNAVETFGEQASKPYARVTMCTLCYELRQALLDSQSEASTASAQRTPSTAADVMPPA